VALWTRAIRPPSDEIPNANDPAAAAPGTVGPPSAAAGDPHGVVLAGDSPPPSGLPRIVPSAWSGWPDGWATSWYGPSRVLVDTAWMCLDLNSSLISTMPPYLVNAAPTLSADWLVNPNPDLYTSWEEFAKQAWWDYQACGETFIIADSFYATGWPARFHVVPPWYVQITVQDGVRRYTIGDADVSSRMLHIRYTSTVGPDGHGHGPLEVGAGRLVAAQVLAEYATKLVGMGGIPTSVLEHPEELTAQQAVDLKAQWVSARISSIGEPAVLSGGVTWKPTQLNPRDMALLELSQFNESRIAALLGVPPYMVGLPSGGDPMTYKNVVNLFDHHWRAGLRPKAQAVTSALSYWALPRGTTVEVNRDAYVQPPPLERAQTAQILNSIVDKLGNPALTVEEIREAERLDDIGTNLAGEVLNTP
jgi:HK97 family phage portal protein